MLRRVTGNSMVPTLVPGQIVYIKTWFYFPRVNDIVMIKHNGLEKIKRIQAIYDQHIVVTGDNARESTDSRQFGPLPTSAVVGKVFCLTHCKLKNP